MSNILKFDVVKHDKIWGNEQWIVSAHPNGVSTITNGDYQGLTLAELFTKHPELFGNSNLSEFPLLVKIIEAEDHLSVQVHPDDVYATKYENSLGKNECWYVMDCEADADIVVGHHLQSKEELEMLINNNDLESKLDIKKINVGDFFDVPAGTIHAIRSGTKILEVQQSSDITYRLYDYGRLENGMPRELHVEKSIDVVDFTPYSQSTPQHRETAQYTTDILVDNQFFTVEKILATTSFEYPNDYNFIIGVALNDQVVVNQEQFSANQGFLVPAGENLNIEEGSEVYISYIR
ncbi:type I phosphomannose isomerase catalytic subunit [Mollicutes bacterium LVI A0039]|nr:type I phosphomannose isomerase catalytic subunit [Mollicutes bacterium LVI A0039]